jgi:hypothetical protein
MDALTKQRVLTLGGPVDEHRALLVVQGNDEPEVVARLDADPWANSTLTIQKRRPLGRSGFAQGQTPRAPKFEEPQVPPQLLRRLGSPTRSDFDRAAPGEVLPPEANQAAWATASRSRGRARLVRPPDRAAARQAIVGRSVLDRGSARILVGEVLLRAAEERVGHLDVSSSAAFSASVNR